MFASSYAGATNLPAIAPDSEIQPASDRLTAKLATELVSLVFARQLTVERSQDRYPRPSGTQKVFHAEIAWYQPKPNRLSHACAADWSANFVVNDTDPNCSVNFAENSFDLPRVSPLCRRRQK